MSQILDTPTKKKKLFFFHHKICLQDPKDSLMIKEIMWKDQDASSESVEVSLRRTLVHRGPVVQILQKACEQENNLGRLGVVRN
ncbi:hypothetical protein CEXT_549231 [Caerostris extrusa]|uniref:Uncharacterized protein n=1 Tax=Caerostris extrusa TaxID=172846 RepID=A0AAV4PU22_CAEEX|nr:hypothetical protein CEXT_549231 [Caerostris extrusa]